MLPANMQERFTKGMATPVSKPGWRRAWVAFDAAGAIAGHIDLRGRPEPASAHRALLGMGVRRDCRRLGLGTGLISIAAEWARAAGFSWIDLEVLSANTGAIALYQRTHFRVIGECADLYRIDGEIHGCTLMSRQLS